MTAPPATEAALLAVAHAAARAAGAELMRRFGGEPVGLRAKSTPTDPVSAADLAAEAAIRDVLARERPGDAILGEEGGATGPAVGAGGAGGTGGALRWIVDPLDGTVNYLYGIPQFAVSIACEDAAGALAGVVLNPVDGEVFAATRSGPATRNGEPIAGSEVTELGWTLVATGFGYAPEIRAAQAATLARMLPLVRDVRRAGAAALDLCACACGRVDAYYERGVKAWDVAAGTLICRRAGLEVRTLAPLDGLPDGVLAAPAPLIGQIEALIAAPRQP